MQTEYCVAPLMTEHIKFDVCITATLRPDILRRTLKSFYDKCLQHHIHECRAVVNIDCVGGSINGTTIVDVVSEFFAFYKCRVNSIPSFPHAFKWTWLQATAPYVLNLEDDWELLQPVRLEHIVEILNDYDKLALLRLPYRPSDDTHNKSWTHFYPWNGRYFECPHDRIAELGFCGHPSLIKGEYVQRIAPHIDTDRNPEKQFHHGNFKVITAVTDYEYGVYGFPNAGPYVQDLGRQWMIENKMKKKGNKAQFTEWEAL